MYRVAFGAYVLRDGIDRSKELKDFVTATLKNAAIEISSLDLFQSKEHLVEAVKSGDYNLVITYETLKDTSIGAGAIKEWRQLNPNCRIILVVKAFRKGGAKLKGLYEIGYYDTLYDSDFKGIDVSRLLANPRDSKSTIEYYGVEVVEEKEISKEPVPEVTVSGEINAVDVSEDGDAKKESVPKAEDKIEDKKAESLEAELEDEAGELLDMLDGAFDDGEKDGDDSSDSSDADSVDSKDSDDSDKPKMAFDFFSGGTAAVVADEKKEEDMGSGMGFSFFGETSVARKSETVVVEATEIKADAKDDGDDVGESTYYKKEVVYEEAEVVEEKVEADSTSSFTATASSSTAAANLGEVTGIVPRNTRGTDMSGKINGFVVDVMDGHLLTVETKESYYMEWDPSTMSFLVMIQTGQQGRVENGMYRAATTVIRGYGVTFIEDNVLLIEVPDKDLFLISDVILNKNCTLVMKSLS